MISGGAVVLEVADVSRAVRFYIETLGMKLVAELSDASSIIDAGDGFHLELRSGATGGPSSPRAQVTLYTKVPLEEAVAIYENRGVSFTLQGEAGRPKTACFEDQDGHRFALVAPPFDSDERLS
jgi:catechol 2,3-dioxygenase-like lactoylglutathione lyase family enzyme